MLRHLRIRNLIALPGDELVQGFHKRVFYLVFCEVWSFAPMVLVPEFLVALLDDPTVLVIGMPDF